MFNPQAERFAEIARKNNIFLNPPPFKTKEEFKKYAKKLDKKYKIKEDREETYKSIAVKRTISFVLKIATILFFLFTPIGQEALIKIGTKIMRDGSEFIINTYNEKAEQYGIYDQSKPYDLRITTSIVMIMFPLILIIYLLVIILGAVGAWRRARRQDDIDILNDQLEDYQWHKNASRYGLYKDIYNLP